MKKVYWDLAIVLVCIFLIIKYTMLFIAIAGVGAIIWFFVLNDEKKKEIKDKVSNLYK